METNKLTKGNSMTLEFTRYTNAYKGADYKDRAVSMWGEFGTELSCRQNQDTGNVYDLSAFISDDVKLYSAYDVSRNDDGSKLAFTFGDVTIYIPSEQLDEMQAHRPDVTGEGYLDIDAKKAIVI